jgi:hypothetical protein
MTREDKIKQIILSIIMTVAQDPRWVRDVLLNGRLGLNSMTDDEINKEYEIWCEEDDDPEAA